MHISFLLRFKWNPASQTKHCELPFVPSLQKTPVLHIWAHASATRKAKVILHIGDLDKSTQHSSLILLGQDATSKIWKPDHSDPLERVQELCWAKTCTWLAVMHMVSQCSWDESPGCSRKPMDRLAEVSRMLSQTHSDTCDAGISRRPFFSLQSFSAFFSFLSFQALLSFVSLWNREGGSFHTHTMHGSP